MEERSPPAPLAASVTGAPFTLLVDFDQPIDEVPLDPANWSGRTGGPFFSVFTGFGTPSVVGKRVRVPVQLGAPLGGPGQVTYAAAPADVRNRYLQKAPAFLNFPFS